jgi:hypothetical protein
MQGKARKQRKIRGKKHKKNCTKRNTYSCIHPRESRHISTIFVRNSRSRTVFSVLQMELVPFFMSFISVSFPASLRLLNPVSRMETCKRFWMFPANPVGLKLPSSNTLGKLHTSPKQTGGISNETLELDSQTQEPTQNLLTLALARQSEENLKRKAEGDSNKTTKRLKVSIGTAVDLCD